MGNTNFLVRTLLKAKSIIITAFSLFMFFSYLQFWYFLLLLSYFNISPFPLSLFLLSTFSFPPFLLLQHLIQFDNPFFKRWQPIRPLFLVPLNTHIRLTSFSTNPSKTFNTLPSTNENVQI